MTTKYTVYKVVEDREVEIPDACPNCRASFKAPDSALMEWDWHDAGGRVDISTGDFDQGMTKDGDAYFPCSFWCVDCGWNTERTEPLQTPTEVAS